jgi:hypothetical protein
MSRQAKKQKKQIAKKVDKYDLYLRSVQSPDNEAEFFDRVYSKEFDKKAKILREDFCGTFAVSCYWAKSGSDQQAIGVDLDPEPLAWGREHILSQLDAEAQKRVHLIQDDVLEAGGVKADIVAAQNFSFWIFKTRDLVRQYFEAIHRNLNDEGVAVLDMMGGAESLEEDHQDHREIDEPPIVAGSPKKFTYVWDQVRHDPITHDSLFKIHFEFNDGSKLKKAFEYSWRWWSVPEVRELLAEAGFSRSDVYWDVAPDDEDDDYRRRKQAPNDPAWVSYIVAIK